MNSFTFKAIGTEWCITVDDGEINSKIKNKVLSRVQTFETQFSRFLPDSEVNNFRHAEAGLHPVSKEFYTLIKRADLLREYTNGVYDPAVGELLERAGYDQEYSFKVDDEIENFQVSNWSLKSDSLKLDGPATFDFGGIGKGYAIDLVASLLEEDGYRHYMVEAGGDMFGTSKADGSPWNIAIQYPGRPDEAAGTTTLLGEAIAVSDTFRRRWGKWNHIMHPYTKTSIHNIIGAVSVAHTAFDADCLTSVLFLGEKESYRAASKEFDASYLVFYADGSCLKSSNWQGDIFQ